MNQSRKTLWVILLIFSSVAGFALSLYMHRPTRDTHRSRVYHSPVILVKQFQDDKAAGQKIYQHFCASCHAQNPRVNVNAPCITDKKRWQRIERMGKAALLQIVRQGRGMMPPRGGCFECSDTQLAATLDYMLAQTDDAATSTG